MSEASSRNHRATAPAAPAIGQESSEAASTPASKPPAAAKPLCDVDAVLFRAVNECRSHEEVRYYLNGVYVHPHPEKGALLVGTDGHRLVCAHDETGYCKKPVIIEVEGKVLSPIKIPKSPDQSRPRLVLADDGHVIVGTYRSLKRSIIDGTFPNYVLVLKPLLELLRKNQFQPASFKPEYLADFRKVADIIGAAGTGMRIITTSESDAALVLFAGAPEAFGVLMPMRTSLTNGFPGWMKPVLEPPPPVAAKKAKAKKAAKIKRVAKPKKRRR